MFLVVALFDSFLLDLGCLRGRGWLELFGWLFVGIFGWRWFDLDLFLFV